jgi:hypothetical protein
MRDGNCVTAYADSEANASQRAQQLGGGIVSDRFVCRAAFLEAF